MTLVIFSQPVIMPSAPQDTRLAGPMWYQMGKRGALAAVEAGH